MNAGLGNRGPVKTFPQHKLRQLCIYKNKANKLNEIHLLLAIRIPIPPLSFFKGNSLILVGIVFKNLVRTPPGRRRVQMENSRSLDLPEELLDC